MATREDLANFQKQREHWRPFIPLFSTYIVRVQLSEQINDALSGDIMDKYSDCQLRKFDHGELVTLNMCFKETIYSAKFAETLANHAPIPLKVVNSYIIHQGHIKTRATQDFQVILHVDTVDGSKFPIDKVEKLTNEKIDHSMISQYIANEPWYPMYLRCRQGMDENGFYGARLDLKLSYKGEVPDRLLIAVYYRVCTRFCNFLEPLTFYFHSLMTESWTKDGVNRKIIKDNHDWLEIEKTALLVIFFLQQCRLIPMLLRNTDELLPAYLTLNRIQAWSETGLPFYSHEYVQKKREYQKTSLFSKLSVGTLFALMLNFYTETCPLDKMKIYFDQGIYAEYAPSEKRKFIIESVLIRNPEKSQEKELMFKSVYTMIMRKLLEYLQSPETSADGLTDAMIEMRSDLEIEKVFELREIEEEREKRENR